MADSMDHQWLLPGKHDAFVVEVLPTGVLRLFEERWEHDCLDIDLDQGTATHRKQGAHETDDPRLWDASVRQLRMHGDEWQVSLLEEDLARWTEAQERDLEAKRNFSRSYPHIDTTKDVEAAERLLDDMKKLEPGWIPLAVDVAKALGDHRTVYRVSDF